MSKHIYHIYTDGSWRPPNYGSYAVIILQDDKEYASLAAPAWGVTINKMELLAICEALSFFSTREKIILHSDSQYAVNCITKWTKYWIKNHWLTATGDPVKNKDVIEKIYNLCQLHDVTLRWIKGHAGNKHNEKCDKLAQDLTRAMVAKTLLPPCG